MGYWPIVLNVLKNSDVVLLVVDARMPEVSRNTEILKKVGKMEKELIIICNKSDLIGKLLLNKMKDENRKWFFVSSIKKTGVKEIKEYLENMVEDKGLRSLRVGVVGYPNVGKSTLINLLSPTANLKVSKKSGTTRKTQWIREGRLRIIDSPGVIPMGDGKNQVGMVAAKDPHKIKDPENVALRIISYLNGRGRVLEKFYGVKSDSESELFNAIGKKRGYLTKGGEIDGNRTSIRIIEDWQKGKIRIE